MDAPIDLVLSRWAFFATAMVLFGWSLFPHYAYPRGRTVGAPMPMAVRIGLAAIALIAGIAWIMALARQLDDAGPVLATIKTILFETSFGPSWIVRLALCLVVFAAACANFPKTLLVASAGLLVCEGWDGHAAAHGLFGELIQALHVLCAGAWIGGLFALAGVVSAARRHGREQEAFAPVRRFSNVGMTIVSFILLTGLINILLLEPKLSFASDYVHVLEVKILLFLTMLALALYNRLRLMARLKTSDGAPSLKALLMTTTTEQALGLCVLLAVSFLGLLDPYMASMPGM